MTGASKSFSFRRPESQNNVLYVRKSTSQTGPVSIVCMDQQALLVAIATFISSIVHEAFVTDISDVMVSLLRIIQRGTVEVELHET